MYKYMYTYQRMFLFSIVAASVSVTAALGETYVQSVRLAYSRSCWLVLLWLMASLAVSSAVVASVGETCVQSVRLTYS